MSRDEAAQLRDLEEIPHDPATDEELNAYARGIVKGIATSATPNCVASILARVRQDNATIDARISAAEGLYEALKPFAEPGRDLTELFCHTKICPPEKCSRCSKVVAARAAIDAWEGKGKG